MDDIEKIKINDLRKKSSSMIMNNFFSIITIAIVTLSLLWWAYYVRPAQIENEKKEKLYQEYLSKQKQEYEKRESQIELSKKLHEKKHHE